MNRKVHRTENPLFEWPQHGDTEGETLDPVNKRSVYPFTKFNGNPDQGARIAISQELENLGLRVEAVVKCIGREIGNVIPIIVKDLAMVAGEQERALLPKLDYVNPFWKADANEECLNMMINKIKRAQRQHAHDLALHGMVDIAVTWLCPLLRPSGADYEDKRVVLVTEEEASFLKKARAYQYKSLDWDTMHYRPQGDEEKVDPSIPRARQIEAQNQTRDEQLAGPERKGGFCACMPLDLLNGLNDLEPSWPINVTKLNVKTIIKPKIMTAEEQTEMNAYYASRYALEEEKKQVLAQEKAKEDAARVTASSAAQKEHDKRRAATYSKTLQNDFERQTHVDFRTPAERFEGSFQSPVRHSRRCACESCLSTRG